LELCGGAPAGVFPTATVSPTSGMPLRPSGRTGIERLRSALCQNEDVQIVARTDDIFATAVWGLPPEVSPVDGGAIPAHAAKKNHKESDAALKRSSGQA